MRPQMTHPALHSAPCLPYRSLKIIHNSFIYPFYFTLTPPVSGMPTVGVHHLLLAYAIISTKPSANVLENSSQRTLWLG